MLVIAIYDIKSTHRYVYGMYVSCIYLYIVIYPNGNAWYYVMLHKYDIRKL